MTQKSQNVDFLGITPLKTWLFRPGRSQSPPRFSPREIRKLRSALQLNQRDFAQHLGLAGKSVISLWESGKRRPTGPLRLLLSQLWEEAVQRGLLPKKS